MVSGRFAQNVLAIPFLINSSKPCGANAFIDGNTERLGAERQGAEHQVVRCVGRKPRERQCHQLPLRQAPSQAKR